MSNYRATMIACLSMLLAVVALLISVAPRLPAAIGASAQQTTNSQPVQAAVANATIPRTFNYQGILRKQDGSLADGTFDMTFRLWDAITG